MSAAAGQVLWLYGPPSVGKSVTAWALYADLLSGEPRGYFDIDQVGMCYPEPDDDPGRYALKARAATALVRRLTQVGARSVIISGVLDERSLRDIQKELGPFGVTFCRLRVGHEELRRRLQSRYGPADVDRALTEAEAWDRRSSTHVVDTGGGSPLAVARRVLELIPAPTGSPVGSASPRPPVPAPVVAGLDRAVLLCGPTGVGKSAVGFALFGLLATGRTTAYLDLQQLGFLADVPLGASSRHALTADCVADLAQQYHAVGAQDLVLSGHVEHPDDVQRYRDTFGGTPLLVCRLRAGSAQLRERITARTRGGGPTLAGDTLLGLSVEDVGAVLEHSLAQQAQMEESAIGDVVIDTDDLGPAEVVQRILTVIAADDRGP